MRWSLAALLIGFGLDLLLGDPRGVPHPVALIGKLISALERMLRLSGCIERLFRNNCVKFDTTIGFIKVKQ